MMTTSIAYFKRFRMEIDLNTLPPVPPLPEGCAWTAWNPALLEAHAEVKCQCFVDEIDGVVFPNLASLAGCRHLMHEITHKPGFKPEATWLIAANGHGNVGTVQGLRDRLGMGAIQNLGVIPAFRGRGLGTALLLKALHGFNRAGLARGILEVTAQNEAAIRLYWRLGFRRRKTVYKAVEANGAAQDSLTFDI
jgi:ribosomal protein S18 acetylase RimI-like enzyme